MSSLPKKQPTLNAIMGIPIIGLPTLLLNTLQFDSVNEVFRWVAAPTPTPPNTFAVIVKKVTEIVNNSSVLQNDDELFFAALANKIYGFMIFLNYNSSVTADLNTAFNVPVGASVTWALTDNNGENQNTVNRTLPCNGVNQGVAMFGSIVMAGTAGDCFFQWAQQLAEVSDSKLLLGSTWVIWEELP